VKGQKVKRSKPQSGRAAGFSPRGPSTFVWPRRLKSAAKVRKIAVVTGSRAEYGLLRTLLRALEQCPHVRLQLIVSGMHLLNGFGHTVRHIQADGRPIAARVPMQNGRDHTLDQARGLARGIEGLARTFEKLDSDLVVVLGDRLEALATASAAVATRRVLAHIHGGDVAVGDVDDSIRHAITKLAHIHLAATADAARRVIRLGERPEFVFNVGAPGLDELMELVKARTVGAKSGALVVQQARGLGARQEEKVMTDLLHAVADEGLTGTIIYPCCDPGFSGIVSAIRRFQRSHRWPVYRSLPRAKFLQALIRASVLVGNSSGGIIESATAGTPAVNVGPRQQGRLRCGPAVIDADETRQDIRRALRKALALRPRMGGRSPYGDGRAGRRMAGILAAVPLDDRLRRKRIAY